MTTTTLRSPILDIRQKLSPEDDQIVLDHKVNVLICGLKMSTTMMAAIHLGEDYSEILVAYRNPNLDALKALFDITQKLILDHKHDIKQVSTIEWQFTPG